MRLIDADALDKAFTELRFNADGELAHWGDRKDWCLHGSEVETLIADAPTVDVDSLNAKHEDIGYEKGYRDGYAEALEATVDAVEVVRCKDCKHYCADPWGYGNCVFEGGVSRRTKESDFCSWGERKEDAEIH